MNAFHGDCILIKTFDMHGAPFNILVDGGPSKTFQYTLNKELTDIGVIHLLILTHIDSDHIGGLIRFFKSSLSNNIEIKKYWFNGPNLLRISSSNKISYDEGKTLEELLLQKNEPKEKWRDQIFYTGDELELRPGIHYQILSPTKDLLELLYTNWPAVTKEIVRRSEDVPISGNAPSQIPKGDLEELAKRSFEPSKKVENDLANSSSIAFILKLPDTSILLLGDARAEIIERSLRGFGYSETNSVQVEYVKVSHHGSKNNTSCAMLDLINSQHFIISTNGGSGRTRHPDREVIARILYHSQRDQNSRRTICFNYPLQKIQYKSGKLIEDADRRTGNWNFDDAVTSLLPVMHKSER